MNRWIYILTLAMLPICVNAQIKIGDFWYILDNEYHTAKVTWGDDFYNLPQYSGDIVIPETVEYEGDNYLVTCIGEMAFQLSRELSSITIPNSVTNIEKGAFYSCENLKHVSFPNNLISIGQWAFAECHNLSSVNLPASLQSIDNAAFRYCDKLTELIIPKNLIHFGNITANDSDSPIAPPFQGCKELSSVIVEEGNPFYDSRDNCNAVIETSTDKLLVGCNNSSIPNSIKAIGDCAFASCDFLSLTIPNSVSTIGSYAFSHCKKLKNITLPDNVSYLGSYAFYNCEALTEIIISNNVTSIESGTFFQCRNLSTISLPNGLKSIGDEAFSFCYNMTSVFLPESLISIGGGAFYSCNQLTSIIIPDNVVNIGNRAFCDCDQLKSIRIPNSVCTIGKEAFAYCDNLTSAQLGSGITSLTGTFTETGLTSIEIPENVVDIGEWTFSYCHLTEVILHDGLKTIGYGAFRSNHDYTEVVLPATVTFIDARAFQANKDKNVTCYAETVPEVNCGTNENYCPFRNTTTGKVFATTLHVPDVALHDYAGTHPWNEFGTIMGFSGATEEPYTGFLPVSATDNKGDVHEVARYSVDGRLLTHPQKGVNIIKMSDGTTKKIVVK